MPHALHVSVSVSVCVHRVAGGEPRQLLKCNRGTVATIVLPAADTTRAHTLRIRHVVHTTQNGFDSTVTAQRGKMGEGVYSR